MARSPSSQTDITPAVLVVDDYDDSRTMACELLRMLGFAAAGAVSSTALVAATTVRPDAIVIELTLRGDSGLGVVRRLRAHRLLARVPVVVVTANTDLDAHQEALRAGCHSVLLKPVRSSVLSRTLRTAIARPRSAREEN